MNAVDNNKNTETAPQPLFAPHRKLALTAPLHWFKLGWKDIQQAPKQSLSYGLIMLAISYFISAAAWAFGNMGLFFGLLSGFVYLGPLLAFTLYDISYRLEKGIPISLKRSMLSAKTQISNAAIFTVLLTVIFLIWARTASMVHIFYPQHSENQTFEMLGFLAIGSAIGALFCAFIFMLSAFSLPMIMDRETDAITAVITSFNAVLSNKPAMLVWAAIIGVCVLIGFATAYLAFIVLLPLLGHASYHAYKETIVASDWPARVCEE